METADACKFFFGALGFSIAQFACTHFAPRCTPFKVRFKGKKRKPKKGDPACWCDFKVQARPLNRRPYIVKMCRAEKCTGDGSRGGSGLRVEPRLNWRQTGENKYAKVKVSRIETFLLCGPAEAGFTWDEFDADEDPSKICSEAVLEKLKESEKIKYLRYKIWEAHHQYGCTYAVSEILAALPRKYHRYVEHGDAHVPLDVPLSVEADKKRAARNSFTHGLQQKLMGELVALYGEKAKFWL